MKPYIIWNTKEKLVSAVEAVSIFIMCVLIFPLIHESSISALYKGKLYLAVLITPFLFIGGIVGYYRRTNNKRIAIRVDEDGILIDIDNAPRLDRSWEWIKSMEFVYKKGYKLPFLHVTCWDGKSTDYMLESWVLNRGRFKKAVLYYSGKDFFKTKLPVVGWRWRS